MVHASAPQLEPTHALGRSHSPDVFLTKGMASSVATQAHANEQPLEDAIKPLNLANVDALDLRLLSFLPPGARFNLFIGNTELSGQVTPLEPIGQLPYRLDVSINQYPCELHIDRVLLNALLSGIAPDLPFDALPRKLGLAVLQAALAPVLQQLVDTRDVQIQLRDINVASPAILRGATTTLKCLYADQCCWAALILTHDTLGLLERLQPGLIQVAPTVSAITGELPLPVRVLLRGTTLTQKMVRQLELHDIVLLEPNFPASLSDIAIPVELIAQDKHLCRATLRGSELQITDFMKVNTMEQTTEDPTHDRIDHLDDLPLDVAFEIARQVLTIEQLNALTPGQIFALDRPLQSPVRVCVQGKAIAEAELVQINDRVGARITRVYATEQRADVTEQRADATERSGALAAGDANRQDDESAEFGAEQTLDGETA